MGLRSTCRSRSAQLLGLAQPLRPRQDLGDSLARVRRDVRGELVRHLEPVRARLEQARLGAGEHARTHLVRVRVRVRVRARVRVRVGVRRRATDRISLRPRAAARLPRASIYLVRVWARARARVRVRVRVRARVMRQG